MPHLLNEQPPHPRKPTLIGTRNESSLHASIKKWYALPGDLFEVWVDGYVIDIQRENLLIEIQTRNFGSIRRKLAALAERHNIRLVYPIASEKVICKTDAAGHEISRRKSPKRGRVENVFGELLRCPALINHDRFEIEVLLIREQEVRRPDGLGSWRRKGVSVTDRKMIEVMQVIRFRTPSDFAALLPSCLPEPFSNKTLALTLKCHVRDSTKMTYCLKKMGAIEMVGKKGNELLYQKLKQ